MTVIDKLKEVSAFLKSQGIEDAAKEAEILIIETLRINKSKLYAGSFEISEDESKQIDALASRRAHREPLQYILGYVDFCGLKIKVGPGVLVPRPETELMVEEITKRFKVQGLRLKILDLCTGSGCLALAIAKHFSQSKVYGTDISGDALRYARENAETNEIRNVTFLRGSLFEPIKKLFTIHYSPFTFDVIVSNPPYIKTTDIPNLQPEINKWEPRNALDGGEDGLTYYRTILSKALKYLTPSCPPLPRGGWGGGVIFLEIGEGQAEEVSVIAMQNGFCNISVIKDYAGIERIIVCCP
ncbi:MAG: peptide chain release factor N(5)-glutamine methyltransferase [Nitrospirae bacterium]|nr:peptide chain release factor N(5)-glutamine methyltransferase [Nitrospirota bacterium]